MCNFYPKKRLGQNFLKNKDLLKKIAGLKNFENTENISYNQIICLFRISILCLTSLYALSDSRAFSLSSFSLYAFASFSSWSACSVKSANSSLRSYYSGTKSIPIIFKNSFFSFVIFILSFLGSPVFSEDSIWWMISCSFWQLLLN